jgi:hypothetical protein
VDLRVREACSTQVEELLKGMVANLRYPFRSPLSELPVLAFFVQIPFSDPKFDVARSFLVYVSANGEVEVKPESANRFGCKQLINNRIGKK